MAGAIPYQRFCITTQPVLYIHEKEQEMDKLTPSQAIRQILDIIELYDMPEKAVQKVKKLCWNIADFKDELPKGGKK